jgi:hypothetical protein
MFCSYCKAARAANEMPCQNCGAPSPMLSMAGWADGQQAARSWNGSEAFSQTQWSMPGSQTSPPPGSSPGDQGSPYWTQNSPAPANQVEQLPWPQFSPAQNPGIEQQPFQVSPSSYPELQQQAGPPSLLPVPYEGGLQVQPGYNQANMPQVFSPQPMLPIEESTIYVPPMYTKPRAIIPRYRIISGFLSIVIVLLTLCTGAGYYAKASGKLAALQRMYTGAPPPSITSGSTTPIPDPVDTIDKGPASDIIPSATTTSRVDQQSRIPLQPQKIFAVNQPFYVTYSVQRPRANGTVIIKWYMDKALYRSMQSPPIKAGATLNGDATMIYAVPASGMAEIYWNNQLALRVYFAVR